MIDMTFFDVFICGIKSAWLVVSLIGSVLIFLFALLAVVYTTQCCIEKITDWRENRGK